MTRRQHHIADLEAKAAEFRLIADLATDKEARERNARLAVELEQTIDLLKQDHAA
jgi:hypothetical protein